MNKIKRGLDTTLAWFCVVLFAVLVVDVTWQVFTRVVLNDPSGWSEELAKYLFIWLGLFGSAFVFGERGHIVVDFAVAKLPDAVKHWIGVLMQLVILVFASLVLVYGGYKISALAWDQNLTGLPVNVGWLYTALPISGVLIVFYTVYHLVAILRRAESGIAADAEPDVL